MKYLYVLLLMIIFDSCIELNGVTNDYNKLSQIQKDKIEKLNSFDNLDLGKIYSINAIQLKEEIKKYPKVLVYVFSNGCISKYCKALTVYEDFSKKKGFKLFLVMNGYMQLYKTTEQPISSLLFSIDDKYYGVRSRTKYTTYFQNELEDKPRKLKRKVKNYQGSLYFFKNGELEKIMKELPNE